MIGLKSWCGTLSCGLVSVCGIVAGCGGSSDSPSSAATIETVNAAGSTNSTSQTRNVLATPMASSGNLTIAGTPSTGVVAGQAYSFVPSATDSSGRSIQYSIAGKPAWAAFNQSTGVLTGTPTTAEVGVSVGIQITASDGTTSVALPVFEITVNPVLSSSTSVPTATLTPPVSTPSANSTQGSVTASWVAPTADTDGSNLTDLSGFKLYYGTASRQYSQSVAVSGPSDLSQIISGLSVGQTYFFAVTALSSAGEESGYSPEVIATIT